MRQVVFSERTCVFELPEDIKGDVLGQPLAGIKYYRRQVETWWYEIQTLQHAMQFASDFHHQDNTCPEHDVVYCDQVVVAWPEGTFLYLTSMSDACAGAGSLFFLIHDDIVQFVPE